MIFSFSSLNESLWLPGLYPNFFLCLLEAPRLKGATLPFIQKTVAFLTPENDIDICIKPEPGCFGVIGAFRKLFALFLSVSLTKIICPMSLVPHSPSWSQPACRRQEWSQLLDDFNVKMS